MINVAVVGCGYWGPKHIRNFHEIPEVNVAAVCDLDDTKLKQVKSQYPYIEPVTNYGDLLQSRVDAVVIATPVNTHCKLAKEALLHDKHVLVEKPMTSTSAEAVELIELAEKRNLVLMVGHTYEYHPAIDFLRQLVRDDGLGDIYAIDSARLNLGLFRDDVDVLWDLAPHDICIVLSMLDQNPVAVSARGGCHIDPGMYDVAYLELLFPNKAMSHIHVSWLHPRKIRQLTIVGSEKMAVYDDVSEAEQIHIYDKGLAIDDSGDSKFGTWPPNYRYGNVVIPFIANTEPLKLECRHFLDCVVEGKKPRTDGWSGLRVVNILEQASRSLANGGLRVQLDAPAQIVKSSLATAK